MLLEIDDQTFDGLFVSRLLADYKMVVEDVLRIEETQSPSSGQLQDLEYDRHLLTCMEQVLHYYAGDGWAQRL